MISARACHGFDALTLRSLRAAMVGPNDAVDMLQTLPPQALAAEPLAVMLSVTSYQFRVVMVLHYALDEATRRHFAQKNGTQPEDFSDKALDDAVAECGNLVCGTFNRELGRVFPHVGMSTPRRLRRECVANIDKLQSQHLGRFRLALDAGLAFGVTLAVNAYGELDFATPEEEAAESAGELEFF